MAKVKDSISVSFVDEDGFSTNLHLLWDCDDDVGYGVEFLSDEEGITGWAFGDNSLESYLLSSNWFEFVAEILESTKNLPENIINEFDLWVEEGSPTKEDEETVLKMIELMTNFLGYHPLEEKEVNESLHLFGWTKEEGIWTKFIQKSQSE